MKLFPQSWYEAFYLACALGQIGVAVCVLVAVALVIVECFVRVSVGPQRSSEMK